MSTKYTMFVILKSSDPDSLETEVNEYFQGGWELHGPTWSARVETVEYQHSGNILHINRFYQAMIKAKVPESYVGRVIHVGGKKDDGE